MRARAYGFVALLIFGPVVGVGAQDLQQLVVDDLSSDAYFGGSIGVEGSRLIVGARWDDTRSSNAGAAYVFSQEGGSFWAQEAKLTAGDASNSAFFGGAVDVSGDWAVVGAPGVNRRAGAAYFFQRTASGWVQRSRVGPRGNGARSVFGSAVAIDGDWAVVGAPDHFYNSSTTRTGAIYIYQRSGDSWVEREFRYASDPSSVSYFGHALAIDSDRIGVGAPGKSEGRGAVYVFRLGGGRWSQEARLIPGDVATGDDFGSAVAIQNNLLIVGAPHDNLGAINQGRVHVFRNGGNGWGHEATIDGPARRTSEAFGSSVHIRESDLLIGAPGDGAGIGAVYLFERDSQAKWHQRTKYTPPDPSRRMAFGRTVALGSGDLLFGATGASGNVNRSGVIFSLSGGGSLRQGFQDLEVQLPAISAPQVEWGDIDGDGDLDLAAYGKDDGVTSARIYRNDGEGGFSDIKAAIETPENGSLSWTDLDNDGAIDLVVTGDFGDRNRVHFYLNDGAGNFDQFTDVPMAGLSESRMRWGDYDNDGDLDVIISGIREDGGRRVFLFRNDGKKVFTFIKTDIPMLEDPAFDWGDFDLDGDLDILMAGGRADTVSAVIYRNDGGTFETLEMGLQAPLGEAVFVDFSGDGRLDIFFCGDTPSGALTTTYRNTGGAFERFDDGLPDVTECASSWGDYDNDGDLDIALTGVDDTGRITDVFVNDGDDGFSESRFKLSRISQGVVKWADFDSDGRLDLTVAGITEEGPTMQIYKNRVGFQTNTRPASPKHLTATFDGTSVKLGWESAADRESSGEGLTYNVRVGSKPGGIDIVAPLTNRSGRRAIAASGNVGHLRKAVLSDLPDGRYYWSVQSVDHGFAVSEFAPEMSFTVGQVQPQFVDADAELAGVHRGTLDLVDLNGDSVLDVVLTGVSDEGRVARVFDRARGGGKFVEQSVILPAVSDGATGWGDYDNDGDLDLAVSGRTDEGLISRIYRNDGETSFIPVGVEITPVENGDIEWVDLDNDGDLDLIVAGDAKDGPSTNVYRNDQTDVFVKVAVNLIALSDVTVAVADVDNDHDHDILLAGFSNGTPRTVLHRNDGFPRFSVMDTDIEGVGGGDAAFGDFDADADIDLAITGTAADGPFTGVYVNRLNGSFSLVQSPLRHLHKGSIRWADFDRNGLLDVLVSGIDASGESASAVYRYLGRKDGFKLLPIADLPGVVNGTAVAADFDLDGRMDVLVAGEGGFFSTARVVRNDVDVWENKSPSSPIGLSHRIDGDKLFLFWESAQDAETPSSGLTYDLRIGTSRNGAELMQPTTRLDGTRFAAVQGNVGQNTRWVIKDPPLGRLYWSVHAVDGAFRASGASKTQEIRVGTAQSAFLEAESTLPGVSSAGGSFVDFDNDGDLDISLFGAGEAGDVGGLFANDGKGQFVPIDSDLQPLANVAHDWGDFDGDGYEDLFVSGRWGGDLIARLYRNERDATFEEFEVDFAAVVGGAAEWVDVDGDGDLDLSLIGESLSGPEFVLYINEDSTFSIRETGIPGLFRASLDWGDHDSDGDLDVLVTGSDGVFPVTRVYENNGEGPFTDAGAALMSVFDGTADWVDLDGDGDLDVVVTGHAVEGPASEVYLNSGGGSYVLIPDELPGVRVSSVSWSDFDRDGDPDVAISGWDGSGRLSKVFENDGSGRFKEVFTKLRGVSMGVVIWGDVDGDNDSDLLVAGSGESGRVTRLYTYDASAASGVDETFKITDREAETPSELPLPADGFALRPSYPNPFSSRANLQYAVGSLQRVRVELYNLLGQRVAKILDEMVPANAWQHVILEASDLSSGTYFVRVQGDLFEETQSLIVAK